MSLLISACQVFWAKFGVHIHKLEIRDIHHKLVENQNLSSIEVVLAGTIALILLKIIIQFSVILLARDFNGGI